jgi:hypothetical protein
MFNKRNKNRNRNLKINWDYSMTFLTSCIQHPSFHIMLDIFLKILIKIQILNRVNQEKYENKLRFLTQLGSKFIQNQQFEIN